MSDVIVIFGTQRCGSNFFLSACRQMEGLLVLGEMYHRGGVFPFQQGDAPDYALKLRLAASILAHVPETAKPFFEGVDLAAALSPPAHAALDQALVKFSHRFPNRYFDALKRLADGGRLIFKIFPEHLEMQQILSMLWEQRPKVLLLTRNPVDTFISYRKLTETKKPQGVDTSSLKIKFSKVDYYAYRASLTSYYSAVKSFCDDEGLEVSVVDYDTIHADETADKPDLVRAILARSFGAPVAFRDDRRAFKLFTKQDKSESPADKVLNPAQLPKVPQTVFG